MKDIIIIGAGGVGRETAWIIEQINIKNKTWNILGFIDDDKELWGDCSNGYRILGGLDVLDNYSKDVYLIIAISDYKIKKDIVTNLNSKFKFATIIHPDVYVSCTAKIGQGVIIYPGVIMTTNVIIGNHVIISPKCGIGHSSIINDYVSLLWNVNISGYDVIQEGVLIGSGATVIQNKNIGIGAIIGAGAVVVNNILANTTSIGIPARSLR